MDTPDSVFPRPALLDPALISRLIGRALQRGGDFAEVFAQRRKAAAFELADGEIRSAQSSTEMGVGVRVVRGASVAYAFSDDLREEALLQVAEAASHVAGALHPDVAVVARPLGVRGRAHHADAKRRPSETDLAARLDLLRRADAQARAGAPTLLQVVGFYADMDEDVLIANSDGLLVVDRRALCRLSVEVILKDPSGERRVGTGGGGSRRGVDHYASVQTPEHIADEAVRMARAQFGARPAPAGERMVVVGPASSGVLLHEAVGHGLEADFIRKRTSLFAGRVGEKVASELCTVIDDGSVPLQRGSLNIDDEGTPTGRNVLVERGVLKGFMNDLHNARLLGVAPTGNGRRQSFRYAPLPRMTNTFLAPGTDDPEEIVREVKNGIYCRAFGGGQVDIANGNFVFQVREGYLIEDGKITAPLKGATLVGNGPEVLGKISRVGHDSALDSGSYTCGKEGQSVPVGVGLPTVRIDGITVGGTAT